MTDAAVAEELRSMRETINTLVRFIGPRLTREQLCQRLDISRNTLTKRIEQGQCPRPGKDGKWLLSEIVEWEARR